MSEQFQAKIINSLCVSLFLSSTIFLFGPAYLYFTNILEYSSSFSEICFFFIAISVVCTALLTILLALLKFSIYQKAISFAFVSAFLLWFQGHILVWDYGPLDGREIDWSSHAAYGFIDSGIWVLLLIISIVAAAHICRIARLASLAFVLVQAVSALMVAIAAPDASHLHNKTLVDKEAIFKFSSEKNVVIIVLDEFRADIFQEIINEDSYYKDIFEGFTYYRNALGGYPVTYAAVPLILTGRFYENSVPVQGFIKEAFSTGSLPKILTKNGYQVDLVGGLHCVYADETIASNNIGWIGALVEQNVELKEAAFIFDVTVFRHLPHFAKRYVYNNQSWLFSNMGLDRAFGGFPAGELRNSIEFVRTMAREAKPGNDRYTFKYIHLRPPHLPLRINERLEYEELKLNHENYKRQAKGALRLANLLLEAIKRLGIYDNTMVFVIADHGIFYNAPVGSSRYADVSSRKMLDKIKATALPLFLVKPFMSSGNLKVSDAPVSLSDIAKTIVSELDLEAEISGTSIFQIGDLEVRDRRYLYHTWAADYMIKDFLPPMKEYIVSGFSWLDESWRPTYRLFAPEEVKSISLRRYAYGTNIEFGKRGNYFEYQGYGWSNPEEGFTWTDNMIAALNIPISKPKSDIELKATFQPFIVPGKVDKQRVRVIVNGQDFGEWVATENELQEQTVLIPSRNIATNFLAIYLRLPDAASPAKLGAGEDTRTLGIRMHSMALSEKNHEIVQEPYEWGALIQFGVTGNYMRYQLEGWSLPEKGFTWTDGRTASLTIPVGRIESSLQLKATFCPFVVRNEVEKQRVNILVNGQEVGNWVATRQGEIWEKITRSRGFQEQTAVIPRNLLEDSAIEITFKLPDATSPASLGLSMDSRTLGIAMRSIVLSPLQPDSDTL